MRMSLFLLLVISIVFALCANIIERASEQSSELHRASISGKLDLVQEAINKGTDINRKLEDGSSPLLLAVWSKKLELVKLLLQNGADISVATNTGSE